MCCFFIQQRSLQPAEECMDLACLVQRMVGLPGRVKQPVPVPVRPEQSGLSSCSCHQDVKAHLIYGKAFLGACLHPCTCVPACSTWQYTSADQLQRALCHGGVISPHRCCTHCCMTMMVLVWLVIVTLLSAWSTGSITACLV